QEQSSPLFIVRPSPRNNVEQRKEGTRALLLSSAPFFFQHGSRELIFSRLSYHVEEENLCRAIACFIESAQKQLAFLCEAIFGYREFCCTREHPRFRIETPFEYGLTEGSHTAFAGNGFAKCFYRGQLRGYTRCGIECAFGGGIISSLRIELRKGRHRQCT